ncbi:BapA/Bap/LapF family large adhesin [Acinetobacter indicus]|uniref:BapA/Bap/LapF family large adhesin n=1 Tax=Acinetobacter indicus TaxID=756892 RepID=UPI000CEBB65F|nr:BapA/Bap/LapF family large adhesin [Acinetobacter indicus]
MQIQMISKSTWDTQVVTKELKNLSLSESTVVLIDIRVENIEKIDYSHNKVIIFLNNGEQIIIENFNSEESSLVFRNENSELFLFDFETISYNPIDKIEPLLYGHSSSSFISIWPIAGLVLGGIGLVAGAAGGSGSSSNQAENIPIIDKDKPKVEINVNTNGIITIKPNEPVYKADDKDKTNPIDTVDEWKDLIEVENGTVSIDDKGNLVVKPTNPTQDVVVTLPKDTVKDEAGNGNDKAEGKLPSTGNVELSVPTVVATITVITDNRATLKVVSDRGITGDNTPVVAGTATANSQVNVYANGVLVGQTTADNKGKWSLELPKQADGDVTIEAAEANAAGEGLRSEAKEITVDTVAPKVVSASTDVEGQILITFDKKLSTDLPLAENFTVIVDGKVVKVKDSGISLDESKHNLTLELTSPILKGEDVQVIYLDPTISDDPNAIQSQVGTDNPGFSINVDTTHAVPLLQANNDYNLVNFGLENVEPWTDIIVVNDKAVLGLLDSYTESAGVEFAVKNADDNSVLSDVLITVKQTDLLSVATGFKVVILRENEKTGQFEEYAVKTVQNGGVIADSSILEVLGVVGDGNAIAVNLEDLPAGNYKAVVAKDQSVLSDVLTKLTLAELGSGEKLLGADNEKLILDTLKAVLTKDGQENLLSTVLVGTVSGLLDVVNGLRLDVLLKALTELPLIGEVLDVVDFTTTLVSKLVESTLTIYEKTDISISGKNKYFESKVITGSLITGEEGTDLLGYQDKGKVIAIQTVDAQGDVSEKIVLKFNEGVSQVIKGLYGELTIKENGEYVYKAYGDHNALGQYDKFIYTLCDGYNPDSTAELLIDFLGTTRDPQDLSKSVLYASSDYVEGVLTQPLIKPVLSPLKTGAPLTINDGGNEGKYVDAKSGFITVGLDLGPVIDLGLIESNDDPDAQNVGIRFTVDKGHIQELTVQGDAGGLIIGTIDLYVYKLNTQTGFYEQYYAIDDWFVAVIGGVSDPAKLTLPEGEYVVLANAGSGLTALTGYTLYVTDQKDYDYTVTEDVTFADGSLQLEGNLFTDKSGVGEDRLTQDAKLYAVNGVKFNDQQSLQIQGKYGELTVNKDGSYTYKLDATATGFIGQNESFSYTLYDSKLGLSSTAYLEINLATVDAQNMEKQILITNEVAQEKINIDYSSNLNFQEVYQKSFEIKNGINYDNFSLVLNAERTSITNTVGDAVVKIINAETGKVVYSSGKLSVTKDTWKILELDKGVLSLLPPAKYTLLVDIDSDRTTDVGTLLNWEVKLNANGTSQIIQTSDKNSIQKITGDLITEGNELQLGNHGQIAIAGKTMFIAEKIPQQYESVQVEGLYGTLTLNHNGTYSYLANGNGYGLDTFDYLLIGADGSYDEAVLSINVGANFKGTNSEELIIGTAGDDSITAGLGSDELIYKLLDDNSDNGGNGLDTWTDFHVGNMTTDLNADKIDISALLDGQQSKDNIKDYLFVEIKGEDVTLLVDRDGKAEGFDKEALVKLEGIYTSELSNLQNDDLLQLLINNNQIIY